MPSHKIIFINERCDEKIPLCLGQTADMLIAIAEMLMNQIVILIPTEVESEDSHVEFLLCHSLARRFGKGSPLLHL